MKQPSAARSALRKALGATGAERKAARRRVNDAKVGPGERDPVWEADDAPAYKRHLAKNAPYPEWFEALPG